MLKKIFFVALLTIFLAACGDKGISDKYAGTWKNKDGSSTVVLEYKGDHYRETATGFGKTEVATLIENKDGDLVTDDSSHKIYFSWKDKNTIYGRGSDEYPFYRVTDQK